jgi:hypothetical protein
MAAWHKERYPTITAKEIEELEGYVAAGQFEAAARLRDKLDAEWEATKRKRVRESVGRDRPVTEPKEPKKIEKPKA